MRNMIILAMTAIALAAPAAAGNNAQVMGVGALTCAQFKATDRGDAARESRLFDWAQGAMTGMNSILYASQHTSRDLSGLPLQAQKDRLRAHCDNNPDSTYYLGVLRLYNSLPLVTE